MIRTQEATGKTVDEARAKACALLGVQAEDMNVSYEVLEMPQKTGFLGLKLTPAKVRGWLAWHAVSTRLSSGALFRWSRASR